MCSVNVNNLQIKLFDFYDIDLLLFIFIKQILILMKVMHKPIKIKSQT